MTTSPLRSLAALLPLALAGAAHANEDDAPRWAFSGFGTLGAVHSSERQADFVGSNQQPNGAGRTQQTSLSPDSELGGQVHALLTPELSAVAQLVVQHQYDNSWTPRFEWANVQYQPTSGLRVRVGRIEMPTFAVSQTRFVSYANPWMRPPQEVYLLNTVTSNDGIDATQVSHFGDSVNSLSGFYGSSVAKVPGGRKAVAKSNWGLNDTLEMGATTLRVGYVASEVVTYGPVPQPPGGSSTGAPPDAAPGARRPVWVSIGASHDTGHWFAMGEYVRFFSAVGLDVTSGYVTAGYRSGKWTPYATLAASRTHFSGILAGTPGPAAPGSVGGPGAVSALGSSPAQTSLAVGLRWDFMKNVAAKVQYDHVQLGANSQGQLVELSPDYRPGGRLNLVSAALDFVY